MSERDQRVPPEDIGCLESIEALYAYLDGEIRDPDELAKLEEHVRHCSSCYSRAEMERRLTGRLRATAAVQAPESLQQRLNSLLGKL
jgi:anti-sigma factor (TIGR02949 family)